MKLEEYKKKRNFKATPEPEAKEKSSRKDLIFVVQKHAASRLHYDFRLELDGVLKSWAIPKGPTLDPTIKRLAMMVEDHPFDYKDFEGIIPENNYGAGKVIVWDNGSYHSYETSDRKESEIILRQGLSRGDLKFTLNGKKLKGKFALVKIKTDEKSWLFIKKNDEFATTEDITLEDKSVVTGKSLDDIGNNGKENVWISSKKKIPSKKQVLITNINSIPELDDTPKTSMPHRIKPMLASLIKTPFENPEWLFEIKFDGYRAIAEIENAKIELYSRNNLSFNQKFAPVARALEGYKYNAIIDGEIVILDDTGRSDFQLLQNYQRTGKGNIYYYCFDILYFDGHDLKNLPLIKRKEILQRVLPENNIIRFSDHILQTGKDFFELARKNNLEGIIAKNINSKYYLNRRTQDWLKIKTRLRQEAIICGYTQPRGSRNHFGALVLGLYENGELIYVGHSGGGFDEENLKLIKEKLDPLVQKDCPFKVKPKTNMPVKWVKPKIVCELSFSEWTVEGYMRHPVFMDLREDKDPKSVKREKFESIEPKQETIVEPEQIEMQQTRKIKLKVKANSKKPGNIKPDNKNENFAKNKVDIEIEINKHKLKLTNVNKIYWPDEKYTKGDLIEYYRKISKYMLPYLKDRPESLYRTPNGINAPGFFQKDVKELPPEWIKTEEIYSESNDKNINYLFCQDEATLVYMANLGCIEINPWFSRIQTLDNPDYFVIDLDPEDISFDKVIETAVTTHEVLESAGIKSYPKTSGATGMHIYVPLKAKYDYETAKEFAHVIARIVHNRIPAITSLERSPSKRQKKVYLDYLQNRSGQTLAAPYSVRPKPRATVSTPLFWDEVRPGLTPKLFTIKTIHSRLEKIGDIFNGVLGPGIDIMKSISKLESI